MSNVVGLDLSLTSTGVCLMDSGGEFVTYAITPRSRGTERLIFIKDEIFGLVKDFTDKWVFMEGYSYNSRRGKQFDIGELGGLVKASLFGKVQQEKFIIVPPTSLKKFVVGKGNAKKELIREWVYRKYKVGSEILKTNDEVDAFALCKFGISWINLREGNEEGITKVEKSALESV